MKYLKQIAYILLLIGGLNWGIYGIARYDVVEALFGFKPMISGIIYVLVGLSAVYIIINRYILCTCHRDSCCCDAQSCNECGVTCKVEVPSEIKTE